MLSIADFLPQKSKTFPQDGEKSRLYDGDYPPCMQDPVRKELTKAGNPAVGLVDFGEYLGYKSKTS